jgi:DNA (cytosine-5)-methyltransferase 1
MGGGLEVKLAMNHWALAIKTHNTNFPETEHDCADISATDPRRYQATDILITSPECTNHSLAKGKKRKLQQTENLFGKLTIDPSAERSRATMWDVPRFAEIHGYNLIIVENVVEARSWIMWDAWLHAMSNLGYCHKCVYLNSMHTHPVPQSRDRMYIIFWKKNNKAPDLEFRPKAYCHHCAREIESIQSWKNRDKKFGKYNQQYVYRCPRCAKIVEPYYYAAFNVIDWSIPGTRIGDRKTALADNTMKRIRYGLDKYGDSEFVIYLDHSKAGNLVSGINDPMNTQTTAQVAAIVTSRYTSGIECRVKGMIDPIGTQPGDVSHGILGMPAMLTKGGYNGSVIPMDSPEFTITTQHNYGAVGMPVIIKNYGGGFDPKAAPSGINDKLSTVTTFDHHGVLGVPFIVENFGTSKSKEINKPLGAVTAGGINFGILSNEAVNAFLSYYCGSDMASGMHEASRTVMTRDRIALVMKPTGKIDINDCTYRMLKPHEIQAAMAFERDYIVCGNSRDQVKQLGNAVTPPAMEWLIERGIETFM